ncbi:LacI family transcriptional regulator [Clostridia bacterium]|nr:LacI family transcriptional regulator [Clostridia bacterium]
MPVTIREVSRRCGLSISSVSKALNNYPDVREETRAMVHRVASEIGYFPNALARGLKSNRTYNLGVLLDDELGDNLTHTFFAVVLNQFRREAEMRGYDITLINRNMGDKPLSYLNHCKHRQLDGICLMCVDFSSPEVLELTRGNVISVSIDHPFDGIAGVNSDNRSGMRMLIERALSLGHRRIAYVHGTPSYVTHERIASFRETMSGAGLIVNEDWLVPSHYHSASHAYDAVRRLMSPDGFGGSDGAVESDGSAESIGFAGTGESAASGVHENKPTCILMADDVCALGGMDALRLLGLRVPQDVSIAGFDGVEMIQRIHPRVTTIQQDAKLIGARAAALLLDRIENPAAPVPQAVLAPVTLIEGETVGRVSL